MASVERQLTSLLGAWGATSVVAGEVYRRRLAPGDAWGTGFARQMVGWGAVDLVIAGVGALRGRGRVPTAADQRRLHRILVFNSALDVGYLATGLLMLTRSEQLAARMARVEPDKVRGDGVGIIVQGGFLLVLDAVFAIRTRGVDQSGDTAATST